MRDRERRGPKCCEAPNLSETSFRMERVGRMLGLGCNSQPIPVRSYRCQKCRAVVCVAIDPHGDYDGVKVYHNIEE